MLRRTLPRGLRNKAEAAKKINAIIHNAEEGGLWAEVPGIPGCATQGDTFEDLLENLYEAIEGCVSVEIDPASIESGHASLKSRYEGIVGQSVCSHS